MSGPTRPSPVVPTFTFQLINHRLPKSCLETWLKNNFSRVILDCLKCLINIPLTDSIAKWRAGLRFVFDTSHVKGHFEGWEAT